MHTSASLTLNENASSDVPLDLADDLERIVPERRDYRHLDEGMDDMPAHTKVSAATDLKSCPHTLTFHSVAFFAAHVPFAEVSDICSGSRITQGLTRGVCSKNCSIEAL